MKFFKTFTLKLSFLVSMFLMGHISLSAQSIAGSVTTREGTPIAYASVYIKDGKIGTTTNLDGRFELETGKGTFTLVCAHISYERQERLMVVKASQKTLADFTLAQKKVELEEVIVKAGAEDPAYEIIRKAIGERKNHLDEISDRESMVYMKGIIRSLKVPKTVMGRKVDANEDIFDSTGKGILYFSESLTKYNIQKNGDFKEEVVSAKVSGNSQGFGFNSPNDLELNFYENNISLQGLNSRGFVSPISDNALHFYRYKYEGSFYENGMEVNRISVYPKRLYEPLFSSGTINIIEGSWRIHSLDLKLTKTSQVELVDTLEITQEMRPVNKSVWLPQYTRIQGQFGILGFKLGFDFASTYNEYSLVPKPASFWKSRIIKSIDTSANKKSVEFWEEIRPVPLSEEEKMDYVKKDSLEKKFKNPAYLDSLDKKSNKFRPLSYLMTGYSHINRAKKTRITIPSFLMSVQYNTVEQWAVAFEPSIVKWSDTGSFSINPRLRYSTATNRINMDLNVNKRIGRDYLKRWDLNFAGGRYIYQINPENPIQPLNNTLATLLYTSNYMKIYEKAYGQIGARKALGKGFTLNARVAFEDRKPLENTDTTYHWKKYKGRSYTSNYPEELPAGFFERHQALLTSVQIRYQPGIRYIQYPNRLVSVGSDAPVFSLSFTKAWSGVFGSDARFGKMLFRVTDDFNMKLGGVVKYNFSIGGFINNKNVQLPDWQHFMGNQTIVASPFVKSFQLAPYYANSTRDNLFTAGHIQWDLNGLISNKIPLIRRANIGFTTGINAFYVDPNRNYSEVFFGLTNILKIFRVDFVWGYDGHSKKWVNGIVIGVGGLLSGDGIE